MQDNKVIKGFSKLSRQQKIQLTIQKRGLPQKFEDDLNRYLHPKEQSLFEDISENTVSNYYLPFSLAPNFLINDRMYILPMVIEESSVVAAASKAAAFWAQNGGFKTRVIDVIKTGQIFFQWNGPINHLKSFQIDLEALLHQSTKDVATNMNARGGGIIGFELISVEGMSNTHQLLVKFKTANSMGANFINTCLEKMAVPLINFINDKTELNIAGNAEHIMSILSNYTPECLVECEVSCPIEALAPYSGHYTPGQFAERFKIAVDIAINDPHRATTHNKGIFNGVDAVILATGNDFRATEAGAQAYAARSGQYRSLTTLELNKNHFTYRLTLPLAIGTVGGLTTVHPMVKSALQLLGQPDAEDLMSIAAAAGMANNFAAISALITTGIQKGHMKMHLSNILVSLGATNKERNMAQKEFANQPVTYSAIQTFLNNCR